MPICVWITAFRPGENRSGVARINRLYFCDTSRRARSTVRRRATSDVTGAASRGKAPDAPRSWLPRPGKLGASNTDFRRDELGLVNDRSDTQRVRETEPRSLQAVRAAFAGHAGSRRPRSGTRPAAGLRLRTAGQCSTVRQQRFQLHWTCSSRRCRTSSWIARFE